MFDYARDYVSFVLQELLIKQFSFSFPQALQYHLFGRLRRNTAGVMWQRFIGGYFVSQVSALLYLLGVGNGDLTVRVLNGFHHGFQRVNPHLSGVGVKLHRDVLARCGIVFLESGGQGHLDGLKHLLSG